MEVEQQYNINNNNNNNNNQTSMQQGQSQHHHRQANEQQVVTGAPIDEPPDCTIACDKGHITVHKLVLCEHSKYLQEILSKYPTAEHPIIILTELNIIDVRILVYYMYTGELVITNDASPTSLLKAAQILKIDSLTADDSDDNDTLANNTNEYSSVSSPPAPQANSNNNNRARTARATTTTTARPPINNNHNNNNNNINNNHHHHMQRHRHGQHHILDNDDDDEDDGGVVDDEDVDDDDDNMIFQTERSSSSISHTNNSINNSINDLELERAASRSDPLDLNDTELLEAVAAAAGNQGSGGGGVGGGLQHGSIIDPLDKNNKIRCHLCNIGLSDVKCLYRHVLTRHLPEKWGYKCEFCDREFSRDDHLMRHYTTKHKNMEFDREKIRETRRLNREMAKNFHDQISTA